MVTPRGTVRAAHCVRIFLAGEAVAFDFHSSVLGAFLTGFQAAIAILDQPSATAALSVDRLAARRPAPAVRPDGATVHV